MGDVHKLFAVNTLAHSPSALADNLTELAEAIRSGEEPAERVIVVLETATTVHSIAYGSHMSRAEAVGILTFAVHNMVTGGDG